MIFFKNIFGFYSLILLFLVNKNLHTSLYFTVLTLSWTNKQPA